MMQFMDVDAPLCSFAAVYLNGEYFGLYLAVEGIEESFAQREYGSDVGNLYKPDSMDMDELDFDFDTDALPSGEDFPTAPSGQDGGTASGSAEAGEAGQDVASAAQSAPGGGRGFSLPDGWSQDADGADGLDFSNFGGGFMGSSSQDVALQYIDDDTSSYQNIWDGAVFDITESDQTRLIASLKQLNEGENLDEVVDVDEVLRYFVVHNFSDNFDSYTGSMMHNYYLRENDGQLSIIAWDYNLAFSAFGGAGSAADADTAFSVPPDRQTAPSGVQPPGQTDGTTPDAANGTQTDGQSAAPSFDQLSSFSSLSSVFSPDTWLVIGICVVTLLLSIGFVLFWLKR